MPEFKVDVVKIDNVSPAPNADKLDLINVYGGYPCLVLKGQFKVGDLAAYIVVDSLVSTLRPEFAHLQTSKMKEMAEAGQLNEENSKHRVKAIRLRGTFSMGLLVKVPDTFKEGDNAAEYLGVTKYEEPERRNWKSDSSAVFASTEFEDGPDIPYYDLEHLRKYYKQMKEKLEEMAENGSVSISEKLHGCIKWDSKVFMADGTKKNIQEIVNSVNDEYVLGMDKNGNLVPSRVTEKFINGKTKVWKNIRIKKVHSYTFAGLYCTEEHKFYNPDLKEYVKAKNLKVGDKVLTINPEFDLDYLQEQVLIGKALGDGYFKLYDSRTASMTFGHKESAKEYCDWCNNLLGDLVRSENDEYLSGYGTKMLRSVTKCSMSVSELVKEILGNEDGKQITKEFAKKIGPIALAVWYADDGSLSHNDSQRDRAQFATCNFNDDSCNNLMLALKENFGIESTLKKTKNKNNPKEHNRIYLNEKNAHKLFTIVSPILPECMQYKLPEYYRNKNGGWWPNSPKSYRQIYNISEIVEITEKEAGGYQSVKYDLETETNNYFANGILVHNSSAVMCFTNNRLYVKSRSKFRRNPNPPHKELKIKVADVVRFGFKMGRKFIPGFDKIPQVRKIKKWSWLSLSMDKNSPDMWWEVAEKYNFAEKLKNKPDIAIYGEVYGDGVQDLKYGLKGERKFIAFDAVDMKTKKFLNNDDFLTLCKELDIPTVPVLYEGPLPEFEKLEQMAEIKSSVVCPEQIGEGIVVKSKVESYSPKCGRLALKLVGQTYLLRKGGTEHH